jgi:DNA-binding MarR family transcriptional regulator
MRNASLDSTIDLDVLGDLLSFYLRTITIALSRDLDRRLEGLEVAKGTGKVITLLLVDSHPGIRPSVIARLSTKSQPEIGRIVERLVKADLIERRIASEERRAHELFITPEGKCVAEQVRRLATAQSEDFFSHLSEDDQQQLMRILKTSYRRIVGLELTQD